MQSFPPRMVHLKSGARWRNQRVGLFGGSFDPPHEGHLHIARIAQRRFGLDAVWWLVSPQNPLKKDRKRPDFESRLNKVQDLIAGCPYHYVSPIEKELDSHYSFQTISALDKVFSKTQFLWICGMDNAYIFHKWEGWQEILDHLPVCFIARPPAPKLVYHPPLRLLSGIRHHHDTHGKKTDMSPRQIYWLKSNKMIDISSTQIREKYI